MSNRLRIGTRSIMITYSDNREKAATNTINTDLIDNLSWTFVSLYHDTEALAMVRFDLVGIWISKYILEDLKIYMFYKVRKLKNLT